MYTILTLLLVIVTCDLRQTFTDIFCKGVNIELNASRYSQYSLFGFSVSTTNVGNLLIKVRVKVTQVPQKLTLTK